MSARLAAALVRLATAAIRDPALRTRYREQWQADLDGAQAIGVPVLSVAFGAAVAAVRIAVTDPSSRALWLPAASSRFRRGYGTVQLVLTFPYAWALAFAGYGWLRTGLTVAELRAIPYDPKDLLSPWMLGLLVYGPVIIWLALGGWVLAALTVPAGALLAAGGRGIDRWLPAAGTIAAVGATVLGLSDFGADLRTWLLD